MEALEIYGRDWKKVQAHVGTRTTTQARSHAQKYFAKLEKTNPGAAASFDKLDGKSRSLEESRSQAPTALSSPVCKPEDEVRPTKHPRHSKKSCRKTLRYDSSEPALKTKVVLLKIPKVEAPVAESEVPVKTEAEQFVPQNYEPVAEPQPQLQQLQPEVCYHGPNEVRLELDFEFDNFMPEPMKPLELPADFQLPLPAAVRADIEAESAQEEERVSIDFSDLPGFGFNNYQV